MIHFLLILEHYLIFHGKKSQDGVLPRPLASHISCDQWMGVNAGFCEIKVFWHFTIRHIFNTIYLQIFDLDLVKYQQKTLQ